MNKWRKARKKPIVVEFREVLPKVLIRKMHEMKSPYGYGSVEIWGEVIETTKGTLFAYPDQDYIIRGIKGEIYPIKKEIFWETYDVASEEET